ncbi:hypothetical protein NEMBOFW57_002335 [Staphylotrichum longicolle]|uniref:RNA polymerase Rpb4/RPC9 core domain-containing protein n=1 Tax=Staphylotrichum longicolle TaxID=669026 RepID=A0AAD4F3K2_9PEZI|nr:hypothetical protein NEMBOFW57_002335 [Staphylotrichum longicolle]
MHETNLTPALLPTSTYYLNQKGRKIRTQKDVGPKPRPDGALQAPAAGRGGGGAVLKLGEFEGVDTLTLSEASLVINALMTKRRKDRKDRNETDVLNKTLDYLAFARFKQKENVEPADECKTLIPSLADKISDEELQELLDEMAKLMST